jgi:hypothetical protein
MNERDARVVPTVREETRDPAAPQERAVQDREAHDRDLQAREAPKGSVPNRESEDADVQLLPDERLNEFRTQWEKIQIGFVDKPRASVEAAHGLVDRLVQELVEGFTRQRTELEGTWGKGSDDTEELRRALRRYRSFFNRLLEA